MKTVTLFLTLCFLSVAKAHVYHLHLPDIKTNMDQKIDFEDVMKMTQVALKYMFNIFDKIDTNESSVLRKVLDLPSKSNGKC